MSSVCMPGKSWRKPARVDDRAGEEVRSGGTALLDDRDRNLAEALAQVGPLLEELGQRESPPTSPAGPAPTTRAPTSIRSSAGRWARRRTRPGRTAAGNRRAGRSSAPASASRARQLRDDLVDVADDAEVGVLEDRRVRILVDGDDRARALHPHLVLDRAGDPARDVELRRDGLARLADLARVRVPACVDDRPRRGDGAAESLGEAPRRARSSRVSRGPVRPRRSPRHPRSTGPRSPRGRARACSPAATSPRPRRAPGRPRPSRRSRPARRSRSG